MKVDIDFRKLKREIDECIKTLKYMKTDLKMIRLMEN